MAHFALSDIDGGRYHHFEHFGRPGAGVAGARTTPFAVWLDGWRLASINADFAPLTLQAEAGAVALDLRLEPTVRPVPQGEGGYEHDDEGPDDLPAHFKASLLGCQLQLPIQNGRLALGSWQGIYLGEHRDHGGARRVLATWHGEVI